MIPLILIICCVPVFLSCSQRISVAGNIQGRLHDIDQKLKTLQRLEERVIKLEEKTECNCSNSKDIEDKIIENLKEKVDTMEVTIQTLQTQVSKQHSDIRFRISETNSISHQNRRNLNQIGRTFFIQFRPILMAKPYIDLIPTLEKTLKSLVNKSTTHEKHLEDIKMCHKLRHGKANQTNARDVGNTVFFEDTDKTREHLEIYQKQFQHNHNVSFTSFEKRIFAVERNLSVLQSVLIATNRSQNQIDTLSYKAKQIDKKCNMCISTINQIKHMAEQSELIVEEIYYVKSNVSDIESKLEDEVFHLRNKMDQIIAEVTQTYQTYKQDILGLQHFSNATNAVVRQVTDIIDDLSYETATCNTLMKESVGMIINQTNHLYSKFDSMEYQSNMSTLLVNENLEMVKINVSNIDSKFENEIRYLRNDIDQINLDVTQSYRQCKQDIAELQHLHNATDAIIMKISNTIDGLSVETDMCTDIVIESINILTNKSTIIDQELNRSQEYKHYVEEGLQNITNVLYQYSYNLTCFEKYVHDTNNRMDHFNRTQRSLEEAVSNGLEEKISIIEQSLQNESLNMMELNIKVNKVTLLDQDRNKEINGIENKISKLEQLNSKTAQMINGISYKQSNLIQAHRGNTNTISNMQSTIATLEGSDISTARSVSRLDSSVNILKDWMDLHKKPYRQRVRLVNGGTSSGRLEVNLGNKWGTVCDDDFDSNDAKVVCRQLGYRSGIVHPSAYYGEGSLSILMDDVECTGNEIAIQHCYYTQNHNCGHHEDVGVDCS